MLNIMRIAWDKNHKRLEEVLRNIEKLNNVTWEWLVKTTFETIYNPLDLNRRPHQALDCENMTVIDDGDYQGTLLFLIPFDAYQPDEGDYLMTYAGYGSCSGCDALLSITDCGRRTPNEEDVKDLMALCEDIATNTIKPYNHGWRHSELFDQVEWEENNNESVSE